MASELFKLAAVRLPIIVLSNYIKLIIQSNINFIYVNTIVLLTENIVDKINLKNLCLIYFLTIVILIIIILFDNCHIIFICRQLSYYFLFAGNCHILIVSCTANSNLIIAIAILLLFAGNVYIC